MKSDCLVMKFGGAAFSDLERFSHVADRIAKRYQKNPKLIVVVSAMGQMTNELLDLGKKVHPNPPKRELDMLVSVGERITMSLLAMALSKRGIEAKSFTGSQSGVITSDDHGTADILEVRPTRLQDEVGKGVVIVAGFQGVSAKKEITTLGRGGSDMTAVALAASFNGSVEFYKDVGGLFSHDPKKEKGATLHSKLSYTQALEIIGEGISPVHQKALLLAQKEKVPLHIYPLFEGEEGTRIGSNVFVK